MTNRLACVPMFFLVAACRTIPDGPELKIEYQDIVVHAVPDKARLLFTCTVRASHSAPAAQSHLVFALAPDHPVALTSVRDEHGRRVGEGAVRTLNSAGDAGYYTVVPVTLRQALAAGDPTELEFEYAVDLDAAPGGELVVQEKDLITPIGHSDLRRRLSGGSPSSRFPYRLVAHPADPPDPGASRYLWVGIAPGQRQEAEDPPLQQIFHVRTPRPAMVIAYGPYRPIREDSPSTLEIAALPEISAPRAHRWLALAGQLSAATQELLGTSDAPQGPLRLLPAPVAAPFASGRLVVLPRASLLGFAQDSPDLLDLLATSVARSQLSARGFEVDEHHPALGEGVTRYLGLRALEQDHGDVARRLVDDYQARASAHAAAGDGIRLADVDRMPLDRHRLAGEKLALALLMLDQEVARTSLTRPVQDALQKLSPGAAVTVASLLASLQPAPSPALAQFLLQETGPLQITYSFVSEESAAHHHTRIALHADADAPFSIPLRLWSPWSETTTRGIASRSQPPLDVDTSFVPAAVLIDPFFLPLSVRAAASAVPSGTAEARGLVEALLQAHGGEQVAALSTLSLRGQGFVYDDADHRTDVTALTMLRGKKLLIQGSTQDGLVGSVVAEGPELYLTTLAALAAGDLEAAVLQSSANRALLELARGGNLVAHAEIENATHRLRRVTCFGDHGNLLGHLEIKSYRQADHLLVPTDIDLALDGRRSPWLSFRGELYREHSP